MSRRILAAKVFDEGIERLFGFDISNTNSAIVGFIFIIYCFNGINFNFYSCGLVLIYERSRRREIID